MDTTAPAAPVVSGPADGSITGNNKPAITGTAEANSSVKIYLDGTLLASVTADASGNYVYTPTVALPDGSHTVYSTATDAAGNTSVVSSTNTFTVNAFPVAISLSNTAILENNTVGSMIATLSTVDPNAANTFTYSLVTGAGSVDNASFSLSKNQLLAAVSFDYEQRSSYSLRLRTTNQYGQYIDQVFIISINDVNEAPTLSRILDQETCFTRALQSVKLTGITPGPETAQSVILSVQSTNPGMFNNLSVSSASHGNAILSYNLATTGTAVVTVTVQDNGGRANGGTDSSTQTFTITSDALPTAIINSDKGMQVSKGETVTLTATGGSSYTWDSTPNVSGTSTSATIKVRPAQTTTYQVQVSNASGCSSTANITINVADDYATIQAANILTPNGDGKNDTWVVKNIDLYPNNTVSIFDKGGRKLLEVKHYDNSWAGTLNGSPLNEGTYYYVIDFGEGKAPKKGFITIIRNR